MKSSFGKVFVVFEIILSIAIANVFLIMGSLLSVFLLFPVLLISTLYFMRRMYVYHEFTGIIYNYFHFIKGNILASIKLLYPLVVFVGLLLLSIFYYNQVIFNVIDPFFVWFIYIIQGFLLYQSVGVIIIAAILYGKEEEKSTKKILNKAFIIFNSYPIRGLLAMISLVMGIVFVFTIFPFAYLIVFPTVLFFFYVVYSDVLEPKR